jgi:glycerol-3-phosphate dehydrogenase (NAD(P)+)
MGVITIVGAGMMGSSIGYPAADNGHQIRLVGTPLDRDIISRAQKDGYHLTLKKQLPPSYTCCQIEQLGEALEGAELLVSGVSSFGVEWFAKEVLTSVPETLPVLLVTKGLQDLEDGTLITYPELYERHTEGKKLSLNAVGGPCISFELADHMQTEVCFCGKNMETLKKIKALFQTSYYHLSLSTDVNGVECAVALKNAYALGVSLAIGLSQKLFGREDIQHYNPQAALFGQSVREMGRIIKIMKGNSDNIVLAAGDLYVTVFGGRTRRLGTLLGKGLSFTGALEQLQGVTLESVVIVTRTARAIRKMAAKGLAKEEDFPLLFHMDAILNQGAESAVPWEKFETMTN